jgi:N-formylglutamate deformylase
MSAAIEIERGEAPLLVSLPHTGIAIPAAFTGRFVSRERALDDTDWFIDTLYDFAVALGATTVRTPVSRSIIDVNRDPSGQSLYPGQATTELCPTATFDGRPLYRSGVGPDASEIAQRRRDYFDPYHVALTAEIARLRGRHARIILYDCHSIRSEIPRLFEGRLPNFNIGTNNGVSCAPELTRAIEARCDVSGFSRVTNGRFKGGYITRHYANPSGGVHAVQMELAIRGYMDEPDKDVIPPLFDPERAAPIRRALSDILVACLAFAEGKPIAEDVP